MESGIKKCKYCGTEFLATDIHQQYCSVKCRNRANYEHTLNQTIPKDNWILVQCKERGKEMYVPKYRAKKFTCCSRECIAKYNSKRHSQKIECVCPICGKHFFLKPYYYKRAKIHCCSKHCFAEYKKTSFKGENNHQYGLKGHLNPTFKNKDLICQNNKLTEILVYVGDWYKKYNIHGRITQHRYLVELNHQLFDENLFEEIDGWFYLKNNIEVHHKDLNHNNNSLENLQPMTKSEHLSLHNKLRKIKRNQKGQFIKEHGSK